MKVLVACEFSGRVRDAFTLLGHDAMSCDLLPSDSPHGKHYQGDVFDLIDESFDLVIAHPPCTFLTISGLHWNTKNPERRLKTEQALNFVFHLMIANIPKIAIENPIGCISTNIIKPSQIIQPYDFGEDASKATCLWLKNLPLLKPTGYYPPRIVDGKKRWENQTDSGNNALIPGKDRWKERSLTYHGIADAMANQWGSI